MLKSFSAVTPPLMVRFPSSRDHNIYLQFWGSMFAVHAMQIILFSATLPCAYFLAKLLMFIKRFYL